MAEATPAIPPASSGGFTLTDLEAAISKVVSPLLQKIEALAQSSGCDEIITPFNFGGMPWEDGEKCLRLFAEKVLPVVHEIPQLAPVVVSGVSA